MEKERTLFNSEGKPVAYIDTHDSDMTIYLWEGQPVAYLLGDNIYGFNGSHIGWFVNDISGIITEML